MCNHLGLLVVFALSGLVSLTFAVRWFLAARRDADRYEALAVAIVEAILASQSRQEAERIAQRVRFTLGLERVSAALQIWSETHTEGNKAPPRKPGT